MIRLHNAAVIMRTIIAQMAPNGTALCRCSRDALSPRSSVRRGLRPHADRAAWLQVMVLLGTLNLVTLFAGCAYSHIGTTASTFQQSSAGAPLELRISRHLDTVVRGPDDEEDQTLILKVTDSRLNQKLKVPSATVTPEFTATRFGPRSTGESYSGYLILRKITPDLVDAYLHLDVVARTESGTYKQTAKFHDNYSFRRRTEGNGPTP